MLNFTKKAKLLNFLNSIIYHPLHGPQIERIASVLELTKEDVENEFLHYNLDVFSYEGNQVYESIINRLILHIHNLIEGSWHIERQKTVALFFEKANPKSIADIGFGVPSEYVRELVLKRENSQLVFCDLYESSFQFAKVLLDQWSESWQQKIKFKKTDMDTQEFVGQFDLYILQDAIEHTINPESYLKKHVELSLSNARFLISLPIGPIFPRHYYAWEDDQSGLAWLEKCGLIIEDYKNVFVNPEVDLFSEELGANYHDLYAFCRKK